MRPPRRQFLRLAAGAAAFPASVSAQAYPSRPVKMIVGQAAGSASDVLAGTPLQEAQERHHRRGEVAPIEADPHRFAGRASLRHQ